MPTAQAAITKDVIVVGAGQAGLGVSYYLAQKGIEHVVLERGLPGESWRSQRWDSFALNLIDARSPVYDLCNERIHSHPSPIPASKQIVRDREQVNVGDGLLESNLNIRHGVE